MLAAQVDGRAATTIEGLSVDGLHPLQAAFLEHDGLQCGYCTPGQICAASAMLAEVEAGVPSYVTHDLSGSAMLTCDEGARADERQSVLLRCA